jgi:penicillin-binding protein-related factor A (putative recombinase)
MGEGIVMRNDGKYLEKQVADYIKALNDPGVLVHRLSDSTSARNISSAQPADFILVVRGKPFLLECKSVKQSDRLPKFAQHPRMQRWLLAGVPSRLLIHHYIEGNYRLVDVSTLTLGQASFNLQHILPKNFEEIMEALLA